MAQGDLDHFLFHVVLKTCFAGESLIAKTECYSLGPSSLRARRCPCSLETRATRPGDGLEYVGRYARPEGTITSWDGP